MIATVEQLDTLADRMVVENADAPVPDEAVEAVASLLIDVIERQDAGTEAADGDPDGTRGTRGAR